MALPSNRHSRCTLRRCSIDRRAAVDFSIIFTADSFVRLRLILVGIDAINSGIVVGVKRGARLHRNRVQFSNCYSWRSGVGLLTACVPHSCELCYVLVNFVQFNNIKYQY